MLNSIALLFAAVFVFIFSEIFFYIFGNSKSAEFTENAMKNSLAVEIPVFLLLKNTLFLRIPQGRIKLPEKAKYRKHLIGITVFSAIFWLGVTLFTLFMRNRLAYPMNVFTVSGLIFAVLILLYNLTLRKSITYRNIVVNKPRIAVITAAAVAGAGFLYIQRDTWYTQSYINSVPVVEHSTSMIDYDEATGTYTITKTTDDFKILHLTDIHIGGSLYSYTKDIRALSACFTEIEQHIPTSWLSREICASRWA